MGYTRVSSSRSSAQTLICGAVFSRTLSSRVRALFSALSHNSATFQLCGGFYTAGQALSFLFVPVHFTSKCLKGGNTLLSGFPERLQAEIKGLLAPDAGENVHVSSPEDRDFTVWSGGAMLASMQSFNTAWISLEEYEEQGPQIVHRKCF